MGELVAVAPVDRQVLDLGRWVEIFIVTQNAPLQAPLSVVDDNRKVVGALSVVGATIVKIVSKFQYYFPDFLKKIRISVNQLGFPGIPAKFREIFTEK